MASSNAYLFGQKISITRWSTWRERGKGRSVRIPEWALESQSATDVIQLLSLLSDCYPSLPGCYPNVIRMLSFDVLLWSLNILLLSFVTHLLSFVIRLFFFVMRLLSLLFSCYPCFCYPYYPAEIIVIMSSGVQNFLQLNNVCRPRLHNTTRERKEKKNLQKAGHYLGVKLKYPRWGTFIEWCC